MTRPGTKFRASGLIGNDRLLHGRTLGMAAYATSKTGSIEPAERQSRLGSPRAARLAPMAANRQSGSSTNFRRKPAMQKNLILVANPRAMDPNYFEEIAANVRRESQRVDAFVVTVDQPASVIDDKVWRNPTLIVSFGQTGQFKPPRGILLHNRPIHKYQQYVQFCLAGMNTPRTGNFTRAREYTESDWGEFCILKPADLGKMRKGGIVRLQRTRRLSAFDPAQYPLEHVFRNSRLLVQSFVDTGLRAESWRVLTLLGGPLYFFRSSSPVERPPLDAPDDLIEKAIIEPKHPEGKQLVAYEKLRAFIAAEEVMRSARQVNRAFPRIPLQGCDIVREAATGKLFILEVNPGGNTWHFSSPYFTRQRGLLGGKEAFTRQFDAFAAAARVLAMRAEQLAA